MCHPTLEVSQYAILLEVVINHYIYIYSTVWVLEVISVKVTNLRTTSFTPSTWDVGV